MVGTYATAMEASLLLHNLQQTVYNALVRRKLHSTLHSASKYTSSGKLVMLLVFQGKRGTLGITYAKLQAPILYNLIVKN